MPCLKKNIYDIIKLMRHLYIRIYAFIVMLAIFFIVGMFIFHIIGDTNKEIDNAGVTFHKFEKAIAYEIKNNLLEDDASKHRLKGIAKALDIKGFVIQITPNTGKFFSYPSDSSLFSVVNGNVLIREHSKFLKVFKTESYTTIEDVQQKIYITVLMNIFPSNMIFIRSRTVFFFALALIFLTGLVRILLTIKPTEKVERVYTSFEEKAELVKHSFKTMEEPYEAATPPPPIKHDDVLNTYDTVGENVEELQQDSTHDGSCDTFDSSFSNSSLDKDESLSEEPKGLYSPLTGFGWNAYVMERLESEILRATSTDEDMSFVIIKIKDIDFSSLNMKNISAIILEAFLFRDMIFEYFDENTLGFEVILQDMYLDEAMKICDPLFLKLKNEIYLTGQEPRIGIGITTKACRLANAKIIHKEAEEAVSRALKNKNDPVFGFKPNAEKYRQQTIEGRD